jgi:hypothetical protein
MMKGHNTKRKAEFYLEDKRKIHISLKTGTFYNGYIIEIRSDFLILKDDVLGEMPVFFSEIKDDGLEPYQDVGE